MDSKEDEFMNDSDEPPTKKNISLNNKNTELL